MVSTLAAYVLHVWSVIKINDSSLLLCCNCAVRGDVKLFDFGLATVMPPFGEPYEDSYEMSGAGKSLEEAACYTLFLEPSP